MNRYLGDMVIVKFNRDKHHRKSIRLKEYDYAQCGAYFITVCAQNRECLFGDVQDGEMERNHAGEMLCIIWNDLSNKCPGIVMDEFMVMPNHVHGIICIVGAPLVGALPLGLQIGINDRAGTRPAPTALGNVVGIFKSITTHQYAINVHADKWPPFPGKLWQRNYYEHIIRNESEMNLIRQYIINNPFHWDEDENNPANY